MNQGAFDRLPEDLQKVIMDNSGMDEAVAVGQSWDESDARAREYVAGLGNESYALSDDEHQRWIEAVMPGIDAFLAETQAQGVPAREIYERARARAEELAAQRTDD